MSENKFNYIYGPVYSWRLGKSLGVDPVSQREKICTLDCVYCQLGDTRNFCSERKDFVKTQDILDEINSLPESIEIDYITFSGGGEPTLAKNLGEIIKGIKRARDEKIAVITNSTLLDRKDVQDDLKKVDFVLAKLDCCSQETLESVNRAMKGIDFQRIVDGIADFKSKFSGKLALQIMLVDLNKPIAKEISEIVYQIQPGEVQLNTPLRENAVEPLKKEDLIENIKFHFKDLPVVTVYDVGKGHVEPISDSDTLKRRKLK